MNEKVHFIFQHENPNTHEWEEKHFNSAPKVSCVALVFCCYLFLEQSDSERNARNLVRLVRRFHVYIQIFCVCCPPVSLPSQPYESSEVAFLDRKSMAYFQDFEFVICGKVGERHGTADVLGG